MFDQVSPGEFNVVLEHTVKLNKVILPTKYRNLTFYDLVDYLNPIF